MAMNLRVLKELEISSLAKELSASQERLCSTKLLRIFSECWPLTILACVAFIRNSCRLKIFTNRMNVEWKVLEAVA
jgi:hypothetical protein